MKNVQLHFGGIIKIQHIRVKTIRILQLFYINTKNTYI